MTDTTHDTAPAGEPQATDMPPAQPETAQDDQPLGEAGLKALHREREARKALERRLAALAPLERLAAALAADQGADDGKTDVQRLAERLDAYERQLAEERMARWRVEVAAERGLPPELADRLRGSTREELAADADALRALIPAAGAAPRVPMPDPTQGARGPVDLDAQIADAQRRGDWRTVLSLQNQRLAAIAQQRRYQQ